MQQCWMLGHKGTSFGGNIRSFEVTSVIKIKVHIFKLQFY